MAKRRKSKRVADSKAAAAAAIEEGESGKNAAIGTPEVETPRSSKPRASKSAKKPSAATGADANNTSLRIATKSGKLTKQDVTCPICWSVMISPTTLPCNHSLCEACFRKHVEEASLNCPCCRLRVSVWSRRVFKENKLVDEELWARIKKEFPKLVEARLNGIDSQYIFDEVDEPIDGSTLSSPSLLDKSPKTFDGVLSKRPGEIRNELHQMLQEHQRDVESQRLREETASASLIQQLQEEEARLRESSRNLEEEDFLIARKLQEDLKTEQQLLSSQSQNKKPACRNLMEEWVNSNSPDICELPRSSKTLSQQSKKSKAVINGRCLKSKRTSTSTTSNKKRHSITPSPGSSQVSRASQDVMSKFLFSSQSHVSTNSTVTSHNTSSNDDNQPCCSSSIPKHDIRFSAFSPTKASNRLTIFVPSETLTMSVPVPQSPIDFNFENSAIMKKVEEPLTSKTPDSIKSEVDRHFRPIRSAPKTPPRRRPDGTFLPEPKLFRSTPVRPSTSVGTTLCILSPSKKSSEAGESSRSTCTIVEKRISNDSGRASDDSASPEITGSPSSSLKGSEFASSRVDQNERSCSSEDYRVTPEDAGSLKDKSKKRLNLNTNNENGHIEESPLHKKIKVEVENTWNEGTSGEPTDEASVYVVKQEPVSPNRQFVKRSPLKIDLACSQGIITIDEEDQDYVDVEAEALERFRVKAEQEAADRAFAQSLQRSLNRGMPSPRVRRERYSLRSWLNPQANQIKQEQD